MTSHAMMAGSLRSPAAQQQCTLQGDSVCYIGYHSQASRGALREKPSIATHIDHLTFEHNVEPQCSKSHRGGGVRVAGRAAGEAQQRGADGADGDRHVQPRQKGALIGEERLGLDALRDGRRYPVLRLR